MCDTGVGTALVIPSSLARARKGRCSSPNRPFETWGGCSLPRNGKDERPIAGQAKPRTGSVVDEDDTGCHLHRQPTRSGASRSEEHTSELQSHLNLVCRLLL